MGDVMRDSLDPGRGLLDRRAWLRLGAGGAAALGLPACAAWNEGEQPSGEPPPLRASRRAWRTTDWEDVRAHFLVEPGTAYLNNASIGMPPREVIDAVAAGYRAMAELPARGRSDLSARITEHVVPGLARLFSVDADELTLTRNASEALHLQSIGVRLDPGDEVLITSQEHPAGRRPWEFRQVREGIRVNRSVHPQSRCRPRRRLLARIEDAVTPRTRAVAFCHVTRGGHLYPVRAICGLARERGLASLVDGAQAVGTVPDRSVVARLRRVRRQPSQVDAGSGRYRLPVRAAGRARPHPHGLRPRRHAGTAAVRVPGHGGLPGARRDRLGRRLRHDPRRRGGGGPVPLSSRTI